MTHTKPPSSDSTDSTDITEGRTRTDLPATYIAPGVPVERTRTFIAEAVLSPTEPLRPWVAIVSIMLFEAAALPAMGPSGAAIPPWTGWLTPGSVGFAALAALIACTALMALPIPKGWRALALTLLGGAVLGLGLALVGKSVASGAFDGPDALSILVLGGTAARLLILAAALSLLTGLAWRRNAPASRGARVTITFGFALGGATFLGLHGLNELTAAPLMGLVETVRQGAFLGDRVASGLALLIPFIALASFGAFRRAPALGGSGIAFVGLWFVLMAPLLALAFYIAPVDRWIAVAEPLAASSILAAGLLLFTGALGTTLAAIRPPQPPTH